MTNMWHVLPKSEEGAIKMNDTDKINAICGALKHPIRCGDEYIAIDPVDRIIYLHFLAFATEIDDDDFVCVTSLLDICTTVPASYLKILKVLEKLQNKGLIIQTDPIEEIYGVEQVVTTKRTFAVRVPDYR